MNNANNIENLIKKFTAFGSFGEFKQAVHRDGYVPTIGKNAAALGLALESRGYRVFWL